VPLSLIPRERRFYDLFDKQATNIVVSAELLHGLEDTAHARECQKAIKTYEHAGDELTHEIIQLLNRTFVTPFNREDIYALTAGMDDLIDYSEEIADTIALYQPATLPGAVHEMSGLILDAARELKTAVNKLYAQKAMNEHWIEVHRIENVGDEVSRKAIAELFRGGFDPLEVVKLKDIYTLLEDSLDRCEDVANVIESIVIKNA
jgi:uncharacterized protein Yka (UPF0111/DUF47 family)